MKKFITKTIVLVSVISFFTDVASEMLYAVTPLYLQSIGYGVIVIGVLEGFAEAFAGISKLFFGRLSDVTNRKKPFIIVGYALSAVAKPYIGFTTNVFSIFGAKFADRIGKGIRTGPRDALLIAESAESNRGKVFGFHRSIDTLGAIVGPLIGMLFLIYRPDHWQLLFTIAFIPGAIAVIAAFFLPKEKGISEEKVVAEGDENTVPKKSLANKVSLHSIFAFWKESSPEYKKLVYGFVCMSLINSTNMFLLLRASELGFSSVAIIAGYLAFNVAYASFSYPMGVFADKKGFKMTYIFGLLAFALTYAVLGFGLPSSSIVLLVGIFIIYGLFGAAEDGMAKAWLSLHIPKNQKATGIGLYLFLSSLSLLVASVGTAFLWRSIGGGLTLTIIAILSLIVTGYFLTLRTPNTVENA
jgi:MFS family permease